VAVLRLEAREFTDLSRWRWLLTDASGAFIADHEVRLDAGCWQFEAFTDLQGYVSWHAAPDRYAADATRIVAEAGAWVGSEVLGDRIVAALAQARPATVRVVVPEGAEELLFRPLGFAHANGRPLSVQDITLVMDIRTSGGNCAPETTPGSWGGVPQGGRLRVLGLFSLPEGGQPLNLRRERHALVRLIRRIAATGKAAEVRALQYGVTRDRLRDVLEEAEGWDVIHISGHGVPGELLLEITAGGPDPVSAEDLAGLLDLARERVKLVTLSACWSAAVTAAGQRRLLRLPVPEARAASGDGSGAGALAAELADRLGCAVLAMRYPVDDEFAIALSGKLYDLLAEKGQPLPQAVGLTLRDLAGQARYPVLSLAAPAIFGGAAAGLRLAAPQRRRGEDDYDTARLKMAGFPPEPGRFVGRTAVMARASAALAAGSGVPGVLLHGMPGGGKTACALELAYGHEHAFESLVWYKAPDEGMDITGALTDFALTLERDLPGFQMIHVLADDAKLAAFMPKLTELAEQKRVLIVIDNAESLLNGNGDWRDKRWGQVTGALCSHAGLGRVIITSRRVPAGTSHAIAPGVSAETPRLRVEAVDALTADEALLLARELPHLRKLIYGELPGMDRDTSRRLALGVLNIAQGHPKLLELADGQAALPEQLSALVEAGDQAWQERGGLPDRFFTAGEAGADGRMAAAGEDYLHVLDAWTRAVTGTLSPGERDLFWFLCCLEEPDRDRPVLEDVWPALWGRLGRDGQPPGLDQALAAVTARGLADALSLADGEQYSYAIHPGIAAAGRAQAGQPFQAAVDIEAAAYWDAAFNHASGEAGGGKVDTRLLVRAGLAAVPYLIRQQQWTHASNSLEAAFSRDPSRENAAAVLPAIQQIAAHEPRAAVVLAKVLQVTDSAAAEKQLRTYLVAAARGDYRAASATAAQLIDLCRDSGRLAEALTLADEMAGYVRQAGLGPWIQLGDKVQRLQILTMMGHAA
jgi:CHAT domain